MNRSNPTLNYQASPAGPPAEHGAGTQEWKMSEAALVRTVKDPETGKEIALTLAFIDEARRTHEALSRGLSDAIIGLWRMKTRRLFLALGYDRFDAYVAEELEFQRNQAFKYITIGEKFDEVLLPQVAGLGITKLAEIASLPPAHIEYFRANRAIRDDRGQVILYEDLQTKPVRDLRKLVRRLNPSAKPKAATPAKPAKKPPKPLNTSRYYIQAAGDTLKVFAALIRGAEWQTPTEMAQATGMDGNKALRCLATLVQEGWARTAGGKYAVSMDFVDDVARAVAARRDAHAAEAQRTHESLTRLAGAARPASTPSFPVF